MTEFYKESNREQWRVNSKPIQNHYCRKTPCTCGGCPDVATMSKPCVVLPVNEDWKNFRVPRREVLTKETVFGDVVVPRLAERNLRRDPRPILSRKPKRVGLWRKIWSMMTA